MNQKHLTNGIETRAMLADLSIGSWAGRKIDRKASAVVTAKEGAAGDAGAWWTRLVPPAALKKVETATGAARAEHNRLTLPWSDSGPRVLPAKMYFDYTSAMREARERFEAAVAEFVGQYPALVADAPKRLGGLFQNFKFPAAESIQARFYFTTSITPLPSAGDFRAELGEDVVAGIRADIERQGREAMATATADVWQRLHDCVSRMAERLGTEDAIFRNSLVGNLKELCGLIPKLNVTGDPALEAARQEVEAKLAGQEPDVLRTDKAARATAAAEARRIAAGMETFFKPAE